MHFKDGNSFSTHPLYLNKLKIQISFPVVYSTRRTACSLSSPKMVPQDQQPNQQLPQRECPEIYLKFDTNPSVCISIPLESKLSNLKDLVFDLFDISPADQRILHKGRQLRDDSLTLSTIGIQPLDVLYLQQQRESEKEPPAAVLNSSPPMESSTAAMGKLFRSPFIKEMLGRPEVMEHMLMADPKIRAMTEKNPEMKKMFTNPETMKEMLEMMTNPDYQKHVQKNVDRALINLNAMPGGFDALKQVYSMQKPLFEEKDPKKAPAVQATVYSTSNSTKQDSLPNPWASKAKETGKQSGKEKDRRIHSSGAFEAQLRELNELGFLDEGKNVRAIEQANGNVQLAVEFLIEEMDHEE